MDVERQDENLGGPLDDNSKFHASPSVPTPKDLADRPAVMSNQATPEVILFSGGPQSEGMDAGLTARAGSTRKSEAHAAGPGIQAPQDGDVGLPLHGENPDEMDVERPDVLPQAPPTGFTQPHSKIQAAPAVPSCQAPQDEVIPSAESHLEGIDPDLFQLTQEICSTQQMQGAQLGDEDKEEKTGDQIYEELTKDVLDEILDQDSDEDEDAIAEILDDQLKSLHPAPETQDPSEDTGDRATAPQTDDPNGQGEGPADDRSNFVRNFNPDAYRICPKTNCRLYDFPAPPEALYADPLFMIDDVKRFALHNGYAIVLRRTVEGKSKLFKCDR
jgi:hypothetical protein